MGMIADDDLTITGHHDFASHLGTTKAHLLFLAKIHSIVFAIWLYDTEKNSLWNSRLSSTWSSGFNENERALDASSTLFISIVSLGSHLKVDVTPRASHSTQSCLTTAQSARIGPPPLTRFATEGFESKFHLTTLPLSHSLTAGCLEQPRSPFSSRIVEDVPIRDDENTSPTFFPRNVAPQPISLESTNTSTSHY